MKAPIEPLENARYRRMVHGLGMKTKDARDDIWIRCKRDPVWFCNTFLWTFDPQNYADSPNRLLILRPYQEDAYMRTWRAIGKHNLIYPKSRRMGVTTLILAAFFHRWMFYPLQSFLLCSAKEDRVDKLGDPSCLMWKLDHMLQCLPPWMQPETDRSLLKFKNMEQDSVINGESTNKDVDRGGVRTAVLADEVATMKDGEEVLAAIKPLSNSIFFVSTPKGAYGVFYRLTQEYTKQFPERVIKLHWTQHPLFAKELTYDLDGRPTSPWYREQAISLGPRKTAQELDIDFLASGGQYFEGELVERLLKMTALDPYTQGEVTGDGFDKPEWEVDKDGKLRLWFYPDDSGRPPVSSYIIGFDIASGKGGAESSQSAAAVYDTITGEKVAEYLNNKITPTNFAKQGALLGRWFHNAKLIWGSQGPGADFGKTLVEDCQYSNVYFRMDEEASIKRKTRKYGFPETGEYRNILFGTYRDALEEGRIINRSRGAIEELRQFIYGPDGSIEHSAAIQKDLDPENKGKLHGDIVVADAMANRLLRETSSPTTTVAAKLDVKTAIFPRGSAGWRYQQDTAKQKKKSAFYYR